MVEVSSCCAIAIPVVVIKEIRLFFLRFVGQDDAWPSVVLVTRTLDNKAGDSTVSLLRRMIRTSITIGIGDKNILITMSRRTLEGISTKVSYKL